MRANGKPQTAFAGHLLDLSAGSASSERHTVQLAQTRDGKAAARELHFHDNESALLLNLLLLLASFASFAVRRLVAACVALGGLLCVSWRRRPQVELSRRLEREQQLAGKLT